MHKTDDARRRGQLLYRAMRRGFKEADLVIGGFAVAHIEDLTSEELDAFETLLGYPDQDLYEWIIGKRPPPAEIQGPVFDRLRQFNVAQASRET